MKIECYYCRGDHPSQLCPNKPIKAHSKSDYKRLKSLGADVEPPTDPIYEFLELHSKRCPKCDSTQLTSDNSFPMVNHKCLNCHHQFPDNQAKPSRAREKSGTEPSTTGTP